MQVAIQILLYEQSLGEVERLFDNLSELRVPEKLSIEIFTGDQSSAPVLPPGEWNQLERRLSGVAWHHERFADNRGFGGGHNRLAMLHAVDILLLNPDGVAPLNLLEKLHEWTRKLKDWGILEVPEIPLELAKGFNPETLETDWASGACMLVHRGTWNKTGGFDERFFMYCEDVDLSWQAKFHGAKVYSLPDVRFFHAKRIATPSVSSALHAPLSEILLNAKYRRRLGVWDRCNRIKRSDPEQLQVLKHARAKLPKQPRLTKWESSTASFAGSETSRMRWVFFPEDQVQPGEPPPDFLLNVVTRGKSSTAQLVQLGLCLAGQTCEQWVWYVEGELEGLRADLPSRIHDRIKPLSEYSGALPCLEAEPTDWLFDYAVQSIGCRWPDVKTVRLLSRTVLKDTYFATERMSSQGPTTNIGGREGELTTPIGVRVVESIEQPIPTSDFKPAKVAIEYGLRRVKDLLTGV